MMRENPITGRILDTAQLSIPPISAPPLLLFRRLWSSSPMAEIIALDSIHTEDAELFAASKESRLMHIYEPAPGLFIAESEKVIRRALADGYEPVSVLFEECFLENDLARELAAVCETAFSAPHEVIRQITGYELTGGILCIMKRRPLPDPKDLCRNARRIAVLERVMNPANVGAIMRSAAAMNMDAVLLTKDCSDPLYRRSARVSMGTVFQIPWTYIDDALCVKEMGFQTAALALTDKAIRIDDPALKRAERLALILGSEGDGLKEETIAGSDFAVKIPMRETVDSLNVAAASAVAFWEVMKQ